MNYYKQGDAANADQIKAAFEELGYCTSTLLFNDESLLFITSNTGISKCYAKGIIADIIKTHPDYQELELPVELMFKVGDWVVFNDSHNSIYQISEIRDSYYMLTHTHGGSMPLSFSQEELIRPWGIEDVRDGDVLITTKIRSCPFIYRKTSCNNGLAYYYAGIDSDGNFREGCIKRTLYHFGPVSDVAPGTKEQRDLLFKKMKEAGYQWDADKKELKKIQPHYDISNFHAGMPVLVRDKDNRKWCYLLYSHYDNTYEDGLCFSAGSVDWRQCIPFNEETKHLLGTTDPCDEKFINW